MHYLEALSRGLWWARQEWATVKVALEHSIPFSPKALHPIAGVMLQLGSAAALRSSIAKPWPWLVVLVLEFANEWTDLTTEVWPNRSQQIAGSCWDVLLTMILPTLLLIAALSSPRLFRSTR